MFENPRGNKISTLRSHGNGAGQAHIKNRNQKGDIKKSKVHIIYVLFCM